MRWAAQALLSKATRGGAAPVGGRAGALAVNAVLLPQTILHHTASTFMQMLSTFLIWQVLAAWMFRVAQDPFRPPERGGGTFSSPFLLGQLGWLLALATNQPCADRPSSP